MVHFFHEADLKKSNHKVIREIAIEQSSGWFFLQRLLEKWSPIFSEYESKMASLNAQMKNHRVFLSTVFNKIKAEIDFEKSKGNQFKSCFSCGFEASLKKSLTNNLFECTCKVCLLKETIIEINCPNCGKQTELDEYEALDLVCSHCEEKVTDEDIDSQLNTEPVTSDNYMDAVSINCARCISLDTVIQHEDYYICKSCLRVENDMQICGWCNEGQTGGGDLEYSYLSGCEFCDGQADHLKDD